MNLRVSVLNKFCLDLILICALALPAGAQESAPKPASGEPSITPAATDPNADTVPVPLPKGEELWARHIQVTGGEAAYLRRKNHLTKLEAKMGNLSVEVTVYKAAPDLSLTVSNLGGRERKQATAGGIAWVTKRSGSYLTGKAESRGPLREGLFNKDLHWRKIYDKAECLGAVDVDGVACYKVKMTPPEGLVITGFFDQASGRHVRDEITHDSQVGPVVVATLYEDYRRVGEILVPHKISIKSPYRNSSMMIQSMETNVELPADIFKVPEQVLEQLKKRQAQEAEAASDAAQSTSPQREAAGDAADKAATDGEQ